MKGLKKRVKGLKQDQLKKVKGLKKGSVGILQLIIVLVNIKSYSIQINS